VNMGILHLMLPTEGHDVRMIKEIKRLLC
jgi:hypothetical protein